MRTGTVPMKTKWIPALVVTLALVPWLGRANAYTPREERLMNAAERGDPAQATYSLASGAAVNAKNDVGEAALRIALRKGHAKIVEILRAHGAKEKVDPPDPVLPFPRSACDPIP
jgi:hypothetical protein